MKEEMQRNWLIQIRGEETQEAVADRAGVSRSNYANIENGKRSPSVETARKIADALGFEWTLFFDQKRFETKQIEVDKEAI